MTQTAMIEKCARRMVSEQGMDWDQLDGGDHGYWESLARAVLTALREPTPEMKLAGAHAITAEMMKANANYDAACDCWATMITAALNQGEG